MDPADCSHAVPRELRPQTGVLPDCVDQGEEGDALTRRDRDAGQEGLGVREVGSELESRSHLGTCALLVAQALEGECTPEGPQATAAPGEVAVLIGGVQRA